MTRASGRAVVAFGALLLFGARDAARASKDWLEARTEHFVVLARTRGGAARERLELLGTELERARSVVRRVLPELGSREGVLRVYALPTAREFARLLPEYGAAAELQVGAVYLAGFRRQQIVVRLDVTSVSLARILVHELVHAAARSAARDFSTCLSEELAELVSSAEIDEAGSRIVLGVEPPPRRGRSPTADAERACVGLARRLLVDDGGTGRRVLQAYVVALRSGVDRETAWKELLEVLGRESRETGSGAASVAIGWEVPSSPPVAIRRVPTERADALLGELLVDRGATEAARPWLDAALARAPDEPVALAARARLELVAGDPATAVAFARRALESGRAQPDVGVTLVAALLARESASPAGDLAEVESALELLEETGQEIEPPWLELGGIYARAGQPDRTVRMCRRALAGDAGSAWSRLLLARALRIDGRLLEAAEEARRAARLAARGDDAVVANNVCWYGAVGGVGPEVTEACERAVALDPERGLYRDSRALVRALRGDLEGAARDLRAFLESTDAEGAHLREQRAAWIERLERGENPFDRATLAGLSDLPF